MKKYDAIIIGFGKGGKTLAADLANHGWNVAVVERSTGMYGCTFIYVRIILDTAYRRNNRRGSGIDEYLLAFQKKESVSVFTTIS